MNALKELQRLLAPARAGKQGKIVRIDAAGRIFVATPRGTIEAKRQPGDATRYAPGQAVTVEGTLLRGKRAAAGKKYIV